MDRFRWTCRSNGRLPLDELEERRGLEIRDWRLEVGDDLEAVVEAVPASVDEASSIDAAAPASTIEPVKSRTAVSNILIMLSLLTAAVGQSILRANPAAPRAGLTWLGIGGILLLFVRWRRKNSQWQWPSLKITNRRRYFYLVALFLGFLAARFVAPNSIPRPTIAILLWLLGIVTAVYALYTPTNDETTSFQPHISRSTLLISTALFFVALILRLFKLAEHPFILNGSEANLGLDVLHILRGMGNPFGTAWLTNPTLPLFLQALPVALFGPSTFSIRLLSPFVGALTVVATFVIGQRLWDRNVGLAAAILADWFPFSPALQPSGSHKRVGTGWRFCWGWVYWQSRGARRGNDRYPGSWLERPLALTSIYSLLHACCQSFCCR